MKRKDTSNFSSQLSPSNQSKLKVVNNPPPPHPSVFQPFVQTTQTNNESGNNDKKKSSWNNNSMPTLSALHNLIRSGEMDYTRYPRWAGILGVLIRGRGKGFTIKELKEKSPQNLIGEIGEDKYNKDFCAETNINLITKELVKQITCEGLIAVIDAVAIEYKDQLEASRDFPKTTVAHRLGVDRHMLNRKINKLFKDKKIKNLEELLKSDVVTNKLLSKTKLLSKASNKADYYDNPISNQPIQKQNDAIHYEFSLFSRNKEQKAPSIPTTIALLPEPTPKPLPPIKTSSTQKDNINQDIPPQGEMQRILSPHPTLIKEEPAETRDIIEQPVLVLNKADLIEVIKILRGSSKCSDNCTFLSQGIINYFKTGKKPVEAASESFSLDHFSIVGYNIGEVPLKRIKQEPSRNRRYQSTAMITTSIVGRHGFGQEAPCDIRYQKTVDGGIDLTQPPIIHVDTHTQKKSHIDDLATALKYEASKNSTKISFGIICLGLCGEYAEDENSGHMLVYYATSNKVTYIDAQTYDCKKKKSINMAICNDLASSLDFAKQANRLNPDTFANIIFYTPLGPDLIPANQNQTNRNAPQTSTQDKLYQPGFASSCAMNTEPFPKTVSNIRSANHYVPMETTNKIPTETANKSPGTKADSGFTDRNPMGKRLQ